MLIFYVIHDFILNLIILLLILYPVLLKLLIIKLNFTNFQILRWWNDLLSWNLILKTICTLIILNFAVILFKSILRSKRIRKSCCSCWYTHSNRSFVPVNLSSLLFFAVCCKDLWPERMMNSVDISGTKLCFLFAFVLPLFTDNYPGN